MTDNELGKALYELTKIFLEIERESSSDDTDKEE